MRHVKVQYLWIREVVQRAEIAVKKVRSQDNPADLLTKLLSCELMDIHVRRLGMSFPGQDDGPEGGCTEFCSEITVLCQACNLGGATAGVLDSSPSQGGATGGPSRLSCIECSLSKWLCESKNFVAILAQ